MAEKEKLNNETKNSYPDSEDEFEDENVEFSFDKQVKSELIDHSGECIILRKTALIDERPKPVQTGLYLKKTTSTPKYAFIDDRLKPV